MLRRTMVLFGLTAALAAAACSDDTDKPVADSVEVDAQADTTAPPDATDDDAAPDVAADTAAVCEHPCLNAFGKNDKSLCPDPKSEWNCVEGCCEAVFRCANDADCAARGFSEGHCADERFGCRCAVETGLCFAWFCGGDADCAQGETCAGGACVAAPTSGLVPRIVDRPVVLAQGAMSQLRADGIDPARPELAVAVTPTWSSSAPSVVAVDGAGRLTGGATAGTADITATLAGGAATTLTVRNVGALTGELQAIVVDEATLAPLTGRYVLASGATGEELANAAIPADGVIVLADAPAGPVTLHVFAEGHDWVSWYGLVAPRTLLLPVPATVYSKVEMDPTGAIDAATTVLDNAGIVEGTPDMTAYDRLGGFELSLTSFALSTALFDFNLKVLLGADVKRYLHPDHNIPQVDETEPLTVPGGVIFNLAGPAVPSFVLSAPAGRHRLWTLGGRLDLTEIAEYSGDIIDSVAGGDLDFTRIVGAIFPLFRVFWSGYDPAVAVSVTGDATAPVHATPALTHPLGLSTSLDVPPLPTLGSLGWADAIFFLGGALTPDGFLVPLGINGGADTSDKEKNPPDGIADGDERTPGKDPFTLPLASLHGGLQGPHAAYLAAIVAVAIPGKNDLRPDSGSAILVRGAPGAGPPAAPPLGSFLGFPLASAWDPVTRRVTVGALEGADTQRVLFKGRGGRHWTVWLEGASVVDLPALTAWLPGQADRATDNVELVLINSLDFAPGVTLAEASAPGGVTLDTLLGHVDRLSFVDVRDPIPAGALR